mmetsp:Transcript_19360/g.68511  ORF Transcript_19360/g.68511 Transcript_19360/m.68511 type:complete len:307 (-) Transcript_19360:127-1047(-)
MLLKYGQNCSWTASWKLSPHCDAPERTLSLSLHMMKKRMQANTNEPNIVAVMNLGCERYRPWNNVTKPRNAAPKKVVTIRQLFPLVGKVHHSASTPAAAYASPTNRNWNGRYLRKTELEQTSSHVTEPSGISTTSCAQLRSAVGSVVSQLSLLHPLPLRVWLLKNVSENTKRANDEPATRKTTVPYDFLFAAARDAARRIAPFTLSLNESESSGSSTCACIAAAASGFRRAASSADSVGKAPGVERAPAGANGFSAWAGGVAEEKTEASAVDAAGAGAGGGAGAPVAAPTAANTSTSSPPGTTGGV